METVFRKEIKYLISRREAMILQQKLDGIMERDIHGENGRYFIRSQYYDSIDDQDLWDNLDGMYEKRKIPYLSAANRHFGWNREMRHFFWNMKQSWL